MFESLHDLAPAEIEEAAAGLQAGAQTAVLVDPSGVYVVFEPCPNYEVDFTCAMQDADGNWKPTPLTPLQFGVIQE